MSASAGPQVAPPAQPITSVSFWDDPSVELNDQRLKKTIPPVPSINEDLQTVKGSGHEVLAYLALQVVKSEDKAVIIRAIASAASILLRDGSNFTGSRFPSVPLTGLECLKDSSLSEETMIATNFVDEEPVSIGEMAELMSADIDELGAYFGVLFLAGNKRCEQKNRTAFNEKRAQSATASIIGDPIIFVPNSDFLADAVLHRVYAAFLSWSPIRANMTQRTVSALDRAWYGPALSFVNMFLLLADNGMSALKIIKEAVLKHPWIRTDFTELQPELHAANEAQNILKRANGKERSFLKAIHGSSFVPVNYNQIDNLLGVCREVLKRTVPTYQNYDGGRITEAQLGQINSKLGLQTQLVNTAAAE